MRNETALLEAIAEKQHEIWAHWMRYLLRVSNRENDGSFTIPTKHAQRWQRQIETPYSDLSEKEKESDREQARKILKIYCLLEESHPDAG